MSRPHLPESTEVAVLTQSRRRCCVCFALERDFSRKRGQIAHLDHNRTNNDPANLAFLCLEHHDEYDTRPSQTKALKRKELEAYRVDLYATVNAFLTLPTASPISLESLKDDDAEDVFFATGEMRFYLADFEHFQGEGVAALGRVGESLARHSQAMDRSNRMTQKVVSAPPGRSRLNAIEEVLRIKGRDFTRFSEEHRAAMRDLQGPTKKMLDALGRACVIFSDLEGATPQMLLPKIEELRSTRQRLIAIKDTAAASKVAIKEGGRSIQAYNKGRRLAMATLEWTATIFGKMIEEIEQYEHRLEELLDYM